MAATGLFSDIVFARSSAYLSNSSVVLNDLLTKPFYSASFPSKYHPVNASSQVQDSFPTILGNLYKVPTSAARPTSISQIENLASSVQSLMSQAEAKSIAAPIANP